MPLTNHNLFFDELWQTHPLPSCFRIADFLGSAQIALTNQPLVVVFALNNRRSEDTELIKALWLTIYNIGYHEIHVFKTQCMNKPNNLNYNNLKFINSFLKIFIINKNLNFGQIISWLDHKNYKTRVWSNNILSITLIMFI